MNRRDTILAIGGVVPLSPVALTIEAHRNALAAEDRNRNDLASAEALHLAERAAWEAFIATPCATPSDAQAKLAYILGSERITNWLFDGNSEPVEILRSLVIKQGDAR